jgi:hypothetical protein
VRVRNVDTSAKTLLALKEAIPRHAQPRAGPKYRVASEFRFKRWNRSMARSVLPIPKGFGIESARGRRDELEDG